MESLYTKYRPQTFADVVGQTHVVTTLERAVIEGRTSHAYLFCGPRGTGKTTMARLLAKALMCEQGEGHLPDGTCEQCRLIAAGEHPDVYELDAASRTGVDNVREEIISRVSFAPVRAPYKMYIIDEVHMLTVAAFNALLKTLEEPPAHVVFVLCTTDPQKIPETILSRVQRFDFHAISNADIQGRLAYICEREGFGYDPEALELVVRHARGGMRDAISELEQLSVSGGGNITVDVARDVLGEVSASTLERMTLALANRDVPSLFAQVESLVESGRDLLQFSRALAARLRDVYVVCAIGGQAGSVSAGADELPALSREAKAFGSVDRVSRALALLSDASTEMRVAPNQRLVLEVAFTKIARPEAELTLEALADRVATLERQVAALSVPGARGGERDAAAVRSEAEPKVQEEPKPRPATVTARKRTEPEGTMAQQALREASAPPVVSRTPQSTPDHAPQPASAPAPQQAPTAVPHPAATAQPVVPQPPVASQAAPQPASGAAQAAAATADPGALQRLWKQVVDGLLAQAPQHGSLLMNSTIVSDDGTQVTVALPKGSAFAVRMLERADVRANVDPMVNSVFGRRHVVFAEEGRVSAAARPTPATSQAVPQAQPAPMPDPAPAENPAAIPVQAPAPGPTSAGNPSARPAQAPDPAPSPQPAPVPEQKPEPAQAPEPPSASTPSYAVPWEPDAYDDMVPYDDLDASPYEEDFAFGGAPAQQTPQVPAPTPQVERSVQVAPMASPEPVAVPEPQPQLDANRSRTLEPEPAPEPAAAPEPDSEPQATPDPAPAPSRTRSAIPADIVNMMTKVFGEGITYTTEPPEPSEDEIPDDAYLAEPTAGPDEGAYLEEPVDDADVDEED